MLQGKRNDKFGPLLDFTFHFNPAMVAFDDPARQRQAQPGAVSLGGVERPEDVGEMFGRDSTAGIDHVNRGSSGRASIST